MTQFLEKSDHDDGLDALEGLPEDGPWSADRQAWEGLVANVLGIHGDITPEELRNTSLRESFRGYQRTDVDALCERAAETIERLQRQRDLLEEQVRSQVARHGLRSQPRVAAPAVAARAPETARELDLIQRTLLLAQRAADEVLAEAQAEAHSVTDEAQASARALVADAEAAARRLADGERRRIEAEVVELTTRRDDLTLDVESLERFSTEYRESIRRAIETEIARLDRTAVTEVARPREPEPKPDPKPDPKPLDRAVLAALASGSGDPDAVPPT